MVPHPLKLVVTGYGAAVCVAAGVLASGWGWIAAAVGFWLSGPIFVLAIGATPPLSRAFERRDGVSERVWDDDAAPCDARMADESAAAESTRWDLDLADERTGADLAAWDRDRLAEQAATGAGNRRGDDRDGARDGDRGGTGNGRERGAGFPDRLASPATSASGPSVAGTGTG